MAALDDDEDEIDQLIAELHASSGAPAPSPGAGGDAGRTGSGDTSRVERWLRMLADAGGSDLLLVAGTPPSMRVNGRMRPLAEGPMDGVDVEEAVLPALPPYARQIYRAAGIADGSFRIAGVGRFRINLHRERGRAAAASSGSAGAGRSGTTRHGGRGRAAAALGALPVGVPRLASLGLPATVELVTQLPRGLVLMGGPTGSGKTTTLAAIVEEINRR